MDDTWHKHCILINTSAAIQHAHLGLDRENAHYAQQYAKHDDFLLNSSVFGQEETLGLLCKPLLGRWSSGSAAHPGLLGCVA